MVDKKQIRESSTLIKQLIREGKIVKPKPNTDDFFLKKSRNALTISKRLLDLFEEEQLDTHLGYQYCLLFYVFCGNSTFGKTQS